MAEGEARMKRRRRHAKENPNYLPWLVIGGGVALLGVGVYFLTKPAAVTTDAAKALPPPNECDTARRLYALAATHPNTPTGAFERIQGDRWAAVCRQKGGTV
jgi:hypothetical protein